MTKNVLVTVGTTEFDLLIKSVCEQNVLQLLKKLGYTNITFQIGHGVYIPDVSCETGLTVNHYRFKKSILEDILNADLIISHAGAGTCLEVLKAKKVLVVVINEQLMGNHQYELARQFYEDGYLHYCTCTTLIDKLNIIDSVELTPFPEGNVDEFVDYLNKAMGFVM